MRKNLPLTSIGRPVGERTNILSTTDAGGKITHVNEDVLAISGYARDKLLGP